MKKRKPFLLKLLPLLSLVLLLAWTVPPAALARTGQAKAEKKSSGSAKQVKPTKPEVQTVPPKHTGLATTAPSPKAESYSSSPTDSSWRGLGGGVLGGLAGSYIGHWLFGGPDAQAGPESGDAPGFGLLDLILLGGLGYFIYWLITRRRRQQTAASQGAYESNPAEADLQPPDQEPEPAPPPKPEWDLETGLQHIERSDPLFSEPKFKDQALDYFFKIQGAWMDRDLSTVKHLLTREMFEILQEDAQKMRRDGLVNRLQNMAVREVNLTEAWQEAGQDYITVRIYVTLLDYTINERSGEIVAGSKMEPVKFEEYWTFTRPVGNHPWQLSAVNQAE